MCRVFPRCLHPCAHSVPNASPTGDAPCWLPRAGVHSSARGWFSPGQRWVRASWHSAGIWTVWTVPSLPLPGLFPHTGHSDCPGRVMTFPPHLPCSLSPCWFLHPSPSLHLLRFTNPTAVLGEALIQHRPPCQICQKAEMERVTQHWNKPLHDPV